VLPVLPVDLHPDEDLGPGGQVSDVPHRAPGQLAAGPGELDGVPEAQVGGGPGGESASRQGPLQQRRVAVSCGIRNLAFGRSHSGTQGSES